MHCLHKMIWGEAMKLRPAQQLAKGMEQLSLPSEVLGGELIELYGDRQILLCGQKGIRSYQEHEIIVELQHCAVEIKGNQLGLVTMTSQEVLIRGIIDSVVFLR